MHKCYISFVNEKFVDNILNEAELIFAHSLMVYQIAGDKLFVMRSYLKL